MFASPALLLRGNASSARNGLSSGNLGSFITELTESTTVQSRLSSRAQEAYKKSQRLSGIEGSRVEPASRDPSNLSKALLGKESSNRLIDGVQDSKFLSRFVRWHSPPAAAISYFDSIAWTKAILDAGTHKLIPFYSRYLHSGNGESRFFAETVHDEKAVPYVLGLCRNDLWPDGGGTEVDKNLPEFMALMHFGQNLEAHPGIVNGGFQGVIFDEVMYCAILQQAHLDNYSSIRPKHYTLDLTTRFKLPVRVNSDVLVRANVISREHRKWILKGEIVDSEGNVLTEGESRWLTAKKPVSSEQALEKTVGKVSSDKSTVLISKGSPLNEPERDVKASLDNLQRLIVKGSPLDESERDIVKASLDKLKIAISEVSRFKGSEKGVTKGSSGNSEKAIPNASK